MAQNLLPEGQWRAVLQIEGDELPFNFETQHNQAWLLNAGERILIDQITQRGDSVVLRMHIFDSELVARLQGNTLSGRWVKNGTKTVELPFSAQLGQTERFVEPYPANADYDFSGTYAVQFAGDDMPAVGIFEQKNDRLTGTFLTVTGDYRYLEGIVRGNRLMLSCFDGSHAFLFTAKATGNNLLDGEFRSGKTYRQAFTARLDANAKLPSPDSLTYLKPGYKKVDFSFPNLAQTQVTPHDSRYKGKVVILQLMGSWCPNCMDETAFLAPFYRQYQSKGLEIIGLAYENKPDFAYAKSRLEVLKKRFNIQYELLVAGTSDKAEAAKSLPMLNHVLAFPTTIVLDKKGRVRKIHTGFSGPGTGIHYERFTEDFTLFIEKLLAE